MDAKTYKFDIDQLPPVFYVLIWFDRVSPSNTNAADERGGRDIENSLAAGQEHDEKDLIDAAGNAHGVNAWHNRV